MENGNTIGEKNINLWEQRNSAIQKLNPDLDNFVICFIAHNSNVCSGLRTHGILFFQQRFSTFIHNARSEDVMNFLNKKPPYTQNIKRAEITAVNKGGEYIDFIIFYQTGEDNNDIGWGWKKATNEDDVKAFLNGEGSYSQPIVLAEIVAVSMTTHREFYIFYTR